MATFNLFVVIAALSIWLFGLFGYALAVKPDQGNDKSFNNSYNLLRFVAASLVLYSHHFPLAGLEEPRVPGYNTAYGGLAIHIFFTLSGFLIYQSLQRNNSFSSFISARFLRICPNLFFAVATTSVLMMVWFNNFENYRAHLTYTLHNATSFAQVPIYGIDGILTGRPNEAINGSLWTLQYEVFYYLLLFALCYFSRYSKYIITLFLFFLLIPEINRSTSNISLLSFQLNVQYLSILGISFLTGSLLAAFWDEISPHRPLVLTISLGFLVICVFLKINGEPFFYGISSVFVITLGSFGFGKWFDKYGDGSYGIYIFAFPVQQLCLIAIDGFWLSMATAFIITTLIGYTTWHIFEERLLRRRKSLSIAIDSVLFSVRKPKLPSK